MLRSQPTASATCIRSIGLRGVVPTGPRPGEPTLGTGDVQVTLRWSSTADLDLEVIDPQGAAINYDNRQSPSGGQLDVDSNGACENTTADPVENVFWPAGGSPDGEYTIVVSYFGECDGGTGPQAYTLEVKLGGADVEVLDASTTDRHTVSSCSR